MKNDISSSKMSMNIESETHIPKVNINNESPNKMLILNQNAFSCKKYYLFNFKFTLET
jgi:hypothetical protein